MSDKRVLVIGLDGFELAVAEPLMAQGRMPHLARMRERAARVDLDHGNARYTGLAWEHFSTGLSPSGASRWAAVEFDQKAYTCTQQPTRMAPFPANQTFSTVVFDAPYFDLAKASDVMGLVNWGAHDPGVDARSQPPGLDAEVLERFGPYPATPFIYGFTWPSVERTRAMGAALTAAVRRRAQVSEWLLGARCPDWNLAIVVISELHSVIEAMWHGVDASHVLHGLPSATPAREAIEAVYEAVDDCLGLLIERFPDADHLLFSMHGMGPNESDVAAMALLPEWLYRRAFGKDMLTKGTADPVSKLCDQQATSWDHHVREHWRGPSPSRRRLPPWLDRAKKLLGGKTRAAPASLWWMPAAWYAPYWRDMPAFALPSFYDGQIRLNVRGRESHGQVAASNYDAVCSDLADSLAACVDPETGRSVVREIACTHPGDPMALNATEADMTVIWEGAPRAIQAPSSGPIGPFAPRRTGGHTGGHGIAWWRGPDAVQGHYGMRSSFDVVPTLLEFLGSPSDGFDGASFLGSIRPTTTTL